MSSKLSKPYYLEYSDAFDRRQQRKLEQERHERIVNWLVAIGMIIFVALVILIAVCGACGRPVRERAAYLEGYYNIDHATAVAWARQGLGKTSEEVLAKGVR